MTRNCSAILAIALASILAACGGGGSSSVSPPPPPPPPSPPSIAMVAPATITLGARVGIAEVWGANFNSSAQVLVDGQQAGYTTLVNSGVLQVDLADSVSATVGTHQFTVQQNTGTSNASPFTVYAPQTVPTVMNALPAYLVGNEVGPPSVVVADVNGDGFADVLVTDWDNSQISILDGNADGSLSPPQVLSIFQAYAVAVGDVNSDGNPDLVSISSDEATTSTVSVLLGDGHGNFQPASSQQTFNGIAPSVVGLTDIDGDGQPDLVLQVQAPSGWNSLVWLKNTGNGSFAPAVTLAPVIYPGVALADFNQDGKPDLLYGLVNPATGTSVFHLLLNQGGGKFTDQVAAGLGGLSGVPTVIDFNVDGIPDLVVPQAVGYGTFTLYSFRGNGDGSFTQVASLPVPDSGQFVVGDFDHDGFPDLAGPGILFLFGDGKGNFTPLSVPGPQWNFVAVGDINGDGIPDIVARVGLCSCGPGPDQPQLPSSAGSLVGKLGKRRVGRCHWRRTAGHLNWRHQ
ncbi:MAG: FG-GAP repeat domain-containing protein [Candidatus Sulfotelmatobacter sp.]